MYFITVFKENQIKRYWVRETDLVLSLLREGYTIYREGTTQIAVLQGDSSILWADLVQSETK